MRMRGAQFVACYRDEDDDDGVMRDFSRLCCCSELLRLCKISEQMRTHQTKIRWHYYDMPGWNMHTHIIRMLCHFFRVWFSVSGSLSLRR